MTSPGTTVAAQTPTTATMTLSQKIEYCRFLAGSGLLPDAFKRQPESVLWALEFGEALGLRGVVAMSAIHVIKGRPAPSAAMAAGLIRAQGHILRVFVTPPTDEHPWGTAVAELMRRDDPDFTFRAVWSVEDAVAAEIVKIKDGRIVPNGAMGANWPKYPRQMMKARALGEVCRDGATDVLLGLHYLAEELEGAELDSTGNIVSSGPAPTIVATVEEDARPVGDHAPVATPDVDTAGPITKPTTIAMMTLFRGAKLDSKAEDVRRKRLRVCEILTGRTLLRSADLTEADGRAIVSKLGAAPDVKAYVDKLLADDQREREEDVREATPDDASPH